jgi:uncharacterized membrane protein YfcA
MIFDVPLGDLALLAGAVAAGGIVTGILAGLFGIGGGAIIVPVLYEVFRVLDVPAQVRMQLCVGTSLAIIIPTTIRSYRIHRVKGLALRDVVRQWAPAAVAGVAVGAVIAAFAPAALFKLAFAVIAAVIACKILFGGERWRLGRELPGRPAMTGYGFLIGLCSSLMGVSGGSISNMILTLYGKPIHNAVATSAGLGVSITVAGALGFMLAGLPHQAAMPPLTIGYVSLIGFALMAPLSSYTAGFGARFAHALPPRRLEVAFGVFMLLMSARFLASLAL